MLLSTTKAMAIHANHVALRDLGKHLRGGHEHRASRHYIEGLHCWVSVIEVHLMGLERATAVLTRHSSNVAEEFDHARLSGADTLDLEVAIPPVVVDVSRPLAWANAHAPL